MNTAFSNIAWSPHDSPAVLALLRSKGISGIEVAPTKVWGDWETATVAAAREYRAWLLGQGFAIPAMQAILFGKPDLHLFAESTHASLIAHLSHVAALGEALGAKVAVLGAPKQRIRGALSVEDAMHRSVALFRTVARQFDAHGICLCIEPNPRRYGCDFITSALEGAELVRAVDHPGFGLHLDAAGMYLEGETLEEVWPSVGALVRHYHISEPDLGDFTRPVVPHEQNLRFLARRGYQGWRSVEMREPGVQLPESGPWQFIGAQT